MQYLAGIYSYDKQVTYLGLLDMTENICKTIEVFGIQSLYYSDSQTKQTIVCFGC